MNVRPYLILSVCGLPLAHRAIKVDEPIGSMLLCDLVVQEHRNGCVEIAVVDPACTIGTTNHVEMILDSGRAAVFGAEDTSSGVHTEILRCTRLARVWLPQF